MATFRGTIPDFSLANPLYVGASVSFFTVDAQGNITGTLATLYADAIGSATLSNPQTLDSEGKFQAPVYIDGPVIGSVVGPNVSSHNTGVINGRGVWRGEYASGTVYFSTDNIKDPVSGNIYAAQDDFTSTSLAADVLAGHLAPIIDQTDLLTGGGGLAIKRAVRVATVGPVTLSGLQTIDGVVGKAGDRVLVKNNVNGAENGIWNMAAGAWVRAVDADLSPKLVDGLIVYVTEGDINHRKGYQLSIPGAFTIGTTPQSWIALDFPYSSIPVQFSSAPDQFLASGAKGYVNIPYDCIITSYFLFGDVAGSILLDVQRVGYADFPPSIDDSICGSSRPKLESAQNASDEALMGWSTQLRQGDVLGFEILTVSGLKTVDISLLVTRN